MNIDWWNTANEILQWAVIIEILFVIVNNNKKIGSYLNKLNNSVKSIKKY